MVLTKHECDSGMRYIVSVPHVVAVWLNETFVSNRDFFWTNSFNSNGTADISEEIYIMMRLRWMK